MNDTAARKAPQAVSIDTIMPGEMARRAELSRRLRLAADHIESHYEQALPLETLARVACMSTYHFVRYFALLHGATPHAYVVSCRTAAARRMLADGVTNHQLIAERSGFGSRSSLYRALAGAAKTGGRAARRHAGRPAPAPGVLSS